MFLNEIIPPLVTYEILVRARLEGLSLRDGIEIMLSVNMSASHREKMIIQPLMSRMDLPGEAPSPQAIFFTWPAPVL